MSAHVFLVPLHETQSCTTDLHHFAKTLLYEALSAGTSTYLSWREDEHFAASTTLKTDFRHHYAAVMYLRVLTSYKTSFDLPLSIWENVCTKSRRVVIYHSLEVWSVWYCRFIMGFPIWIYFEKCFFCCFTFSHSCSNY